MRNDLKRIANALEHLALPALKHDPKTCAICRQKQKPVKKMPQSVVNNTERMARIEAAIKQRRMMAGPEQPVGDMFRYREIKDS